ncbi:sporulation membrane protein YtaF [Bacillus mangrovi]|uniref:Sporulation membrane protein YtaF n=1 Tax=Metabacillus mangrovi TaxID=1491830 RepID=A0A7X2S439_9BACI|nr:sporulation membrane protein YtaF [Metabacillus mangrovi]MTH52885.1 sporulation membrane protein YtaF [Metabacillus mangrovi]
MISASLLVMAIAVSLDSFSVGFSYGLKKMKIPVKSLLIIALCSAFSLLAAMMLGHLLSSFIDPEWTKRLGGIILILIGLWVFYQFLKPSRDLSKEEREKTLFNLEIKSLGIVIHILRKPASADLDGSGHIAGIEALLLGAALSFDAFGAGFGAALLGFSPLAMSLSAAVMSSVFLLAGIQAGHLFAKWSWIEKFSCLPGLLLICIGIWKL